MLLLHQHYFVIISVFIFDYAYVADKNRKRKNTWHELERTGRRSAVRLNVHNRIPNTNTNL